MDQRLLQRTRYILRARARRVQKCPQALFVPACVHFLDWITNHPVLSAITIHLKNSPGDYKGQIAKIIKEAPEAMMLRQNYQPGLYSAKSQNEHAGICLEVMYAVAGLLPLTKETQEYVIENLGEYLTGNNLIEDKAAIETIRDVAVDGLYEYLDEQLDTRNVLYAILLKYKQRSEWYHKSRLRDIQANGLEGKTGERALGVDLQEYVLDQGVEFTVEPSSVSGEVDLMLRDPEGRYILIDDKYIPADASRSFIRKKISDGISQVVRYCNDYNEPDGFLVTFTQTSDTIRLDLEEADGLRYIKLGEKTIYYLAVDIVV